MSAPVPPPSSSPGAPGSPVSGDAEHDAWLHEALRHAPDAAVAPPEALRKAILDEARAAAFASTQAQSQAGSQAKLVAQRRAAVGASAQRNDATAAAPGWVAGIAAFWSWLARPSVAAGFASVLAATLVGVMWWDRPLDETLLSPAPPLVERAPSKSAAPAPVPAPVAESATSPAPSSDATNAPTKADRATPPRDVAKPSVDGARQRTLDQLPRRALTRDEAAVAAGKREPAGNSADEARKDRAESSGAPSTDTQSMAQPFPTSPAGRVAGALAKSVPPAQAPAVESEKKEAADRAAMQSADVADRKQATGSTPRVAPTAADKLGASATTGAAVANAVSARAPAAVRAEAPAPAPIAVVPVAPMPPPAPAALLQPPGLRPLAPVLASLSAEPSRWAQQSDGSSVGPVDAALYAWLARADAAAEWQPMSAAPRSGREMQREANAAARSDDARRGAPITGSSTITLLRDGRPVVTVRIDSYRIIVARQVEGRLQSWSAPKTAAFSDALGASAPAIAR